MSVSHTNILATIVAHKHHELAQWQAELPFEYWLERVSPYPLEQAFTFERSLRVAHPRGYHLIGEIKPASPSEGRMQTALDVEGVVAVYDEAVSGFSVLTDQHFFGGGFDLLEQVRALTRTPVLCKDFIIDTYQVLLAKYSGANAGLLIMKCLDDVQYVTLFECLRSYGMTPVVEVQTLEEVQRALLTRPTVMLINNRNLETFDIDFNTTHQLAKAIPEEVLVISASGIRHAQDVQALLPVCSSFLVGSSLMKAATLQAMKEQLHQLAP